MRESETGSERGKTNGRKRERENKERERVRERERCRERERDVLIKSWIENNKV